MRSELKVPFGRAVSGVFGIAAAQIAIYVPFSFMAITLMEIDSIEQYQGQISILRAIGGTLLVVVITGSFGIGAYKLLRRAAGYS